ncbi:hypothetical protein C8J56DRAFT_1042847 [Mycena floridula]|nr:hypothetical protein C8J56DRAFT_1042847 [Mycena floridula]
MDSKDNLGLLFTLCLGFFLFLLDLTIIGTAAPAITTFFGSPGAIGMYETANLLAFGVMQPIFGKLYSNFDPRPTYLASFFVFIAS